MCLGAMLRQSTQWRDESCGHSCWVFWLSISACTLDKLPGSHADTSYWRNVLKRETSCS